MNSKTNLIKSLVLKLAEDSSLHGVPKIVKSKRTLLKLMWTICFVLSATAMSYYAIKSLLDYLEYNFVTNINIYNEIPTQFPTISFCSTFGSSFDKNFSKNILKCLFNDNSDCQRRPEEFFEPFNDTFFGLCYRFNSGRNAYGNKTNILDSTFRGKDHGLQLNLKIKTNDLSNIGAIKLVIHNNTFRPTILRNIGFTIATGSRFYIELEKHFYSKLEEPYNRCIKDATSFEYNTTLIDYIQNKKESIYTQKYCLDLCYSLKYTEYGKCNCSQTDLDFIYESCFLNAQESEIKNCTKVFTKYFYNQNIFDLCSDYCPAECDTFQYIINPHSFTFPDYGNITEYDQKAFFYNKFKKYEDVKKSFVSFYIYLNELQYTLVSQQPKTELIDLIANVGGLLGLFTGFSFLSLAELVEMVIEIVFILFEYKKNEIKPLKR